MNSVPLTLQEKAEYGFTHRNEITWADLVGTAALTKTIALFPESGVSPGATRIKNVAAKVVTAFAGVAALVVEVGDGGDVDRNLASFDCKSTAGTWKTLQPTTLTNNVYNTADTLDALFTATTDNLTSLTAGEIHIYYHAVDLNKIKSN